MPEVVQSIYVLPPPRISMIYSEIPLKFIGLDLWRLFFSTFVLYSKNKSELNNHDGLIKYISGEHPG